MGEARENTARVCRAQEVSVVPTLLPARTGESQGSAFIKGLMSLGHRSRSLEKPG